MFNKLFQRIVATDGGWAPLVLRVAVGFIFTGHGAQKLFGWFGGGGLQGTAEVMTSLGLHPGYLMALLAGSAEFFGGLLLLAGFLVRPAGAALAFTMIVAIFSAHYQNGLFLSNGGYEFGLALLAASVALLITGAGRASVDERLAREQPAHRGAPATRNLGADPYPGTP
jgi:putative oxidoreductase